MSAQSQAAQILKALRRGEAITPLDALRRFHTLRLSARVWDLRRAGHSIVTNVTELRGRDGTVKRIACYRLAGR